MRSALVLAALGLIGWTSSLSLAQELPPPRAVPGDHAVALVPPPNPPAPPHEGACRRLWEWLTYHPLPSACACGGCCRSCSESCWPRLYQYFLPEHPGCGPGCAHPLPPPAPVEAAAAGPQEAPPTREWQSEPGDLPAPAILPEGPEPGMRRYQDH